MYFDAPESFIDSTTASGASSPTGAADMDHVHHHMFNHHRPPGTSSPEPPGSVAGSMSVGPQSRTRSQLSQQSGFTAATVGQGIGHGFHGWHGDGVGGVHSVGGSISENDHELIGVEENRPQDQPLCGCRCVIS